MDDARKYNQIKTSDVEDPCSHQKECSLMMFSIGGYGCMGVYYVQLGRDLNQTIPCKSRGEDPGDLNNLPMNHPGDADATDVDPNQTPVVGGFCPISPRQPLAPCMFSLCLFCSCEAVANLSDPTKTCTQAAVVRRTPISRGACGKKKSWNVSKFMRGV